MYREENLQLRSRRARRRKMPVSRREQLPVTRPDQAWTMDFVSDQLTVIDAFTREGLASEIGQRLTGEDVVRVCNDLVASRQAPERIYVDNGSEFSGQLFDLWAYHHRVQLDFSRPGKPTDNGLNESFNGSFRDECLNLHWFDELDAARATIEA